MRYLSKNGMLLMALAALLFSVMSALAKFAASRVPSSEVVFFRSLFAVIILVGIHLAQGSRSGPWLGYHRGLLLLRGLLGAGALMLYFFGLTGLTVADAMLLNQCSPLFVLLLSVPFLKEQVGRPQLAMVPVTLLGVALVLQPHLKVFNLAGLSAFGSAALTAGAYICIRKVAREEHAHVVVLYFAVVSLLVSAPVMLPSYQQPDLVTWLAMAGVGALSLTAQMFLTAAYRYDTAGRVSMAGYLGPVFAGLWDAWFWGRMPGWLTVLGALLIIGSLLELARQGRGVPPRPA